MPAQDPFESVVQAAQAGAVWAWERLVNDIDGPLRGYARRQGVLDVDSVVGETWLHIARGIGSFVGTDAGFRSWAFTVAHHRIIDDRRRRTRKPTVSVDASTLDSLAKTSPSAEDEFESHTSSEAVQLLLLDLPASQREVVLLRVIGGFGISEIAEIIGKRPGAVQSLQHRAFKRLRKTVGEGTRFQDEPSIAGVS